MPPAWLCRIHLLVVAASLLLSHTCFAQLTPEILFGSNVTDVSDQMTEQADVAISLFQTGQEDRAREILQQLSDAHPQLPPASVMETKIYMAEGKSKEVRQALERSVRDAPGDPEPYLMVGDLAYRAEHYIEAGLSFDKAQSLVEAYDENPDRKRALTARVHAGQAAIAHVREQYGLEIELLRKWIELQPESLPAHARLARCQYKLGGEDNERAAFATFTKLYNEIDEAEEPDKTARRPETSMARLLAQDGKLDKATRWMEAALRQAPADDLKTRVQVVRWALDNGRLELATKAAEEAAAIDSDSAQVLLLQGLAWRYNGNASRAIDHLRAANAKAPRSFVIVNNLALALVEMPEKDKLEEALTLAKENQRRHDTLDTPLGREAASTLAWVQYRLGDADEAEKAMRQVVQVGSVSTESAFHAAQVFHAHGDNDTARKILESLLQQTVYFPGQERARELLEKLKAEAD